MSNTRSDGMPAHTWKTGSELGTPIDSRLYAMEVCKDCGVLRGPVEYPETACKGSIHTEINHHDCCTA